MLVFLLVCAIHSIIPSDEIIMVSGMVDESNLEDYEITCASNSECETKLANTNGIGKKIILKTDGNIKVKIKEISPSITHMDVEPNYIFYLDFDEEMNMTTTSTFIQIEKPHLLKIKVINYWLKFSTSVNGLDCYINGDDALAEGFEFDGPFNLFIDNEMCVPDHRNTNSITLNYNRNILTFSDDNRLNTVGTNLLILNSLNIRINITNEGLTDIVINNLNPLKESYNPYKVFLNQITTVTVDVNVNLNRNGLHHIELVSDHQIILKAKDTRRAHYYYFINNNFICDHYFICNDNFTNMCNVPNGLHTNQIKTIYEMKNIFKYNVTTIDQYSFTIGNPSQAKNPIEIPDGFDYKHHYFYNNDNDNVYIMIPEETHSISLENTYCNIFKTDSLEFHYTLIGDNCFIFLVALAEGECELYDKRDSSDYLEGMVKAVIKYSTTITLFGDETSYKKYSLISANEENITVKFKMTEYNHFSFNEIALEKISRIEIISNDLLPFEKLTKVYPEIDIICDSSQNIISLSDNSVSFNSGVVFHANLLIFNTTINNIALSIKENSKYLPNMEINVLSKTDIILVFDSTWNSFLSSASSIKFYHPNSDLFIETPTQTNPNINFNPPPSFKENYCVVINKDSSECPLEHKQVTQVELYEIMNKNTNINFNIAVSGDNKDNQLTIPKRYFINNKINLLASNNVGIYIRITDWKASNIIQQNNNFSIDGYIMNIPKEYVVNIQLSNNVSIEHKGGIGYLTMYLNLTDNTTLSFSGDSKKSNNFYFFFGEYTTTLFTTVVISNSINNLNHIILGSNDQIGKIYGSISHCNSFEVSVETDQIRVNNAYVEIRNEGNKKFQIDLDFANKIILNSNSSTLQLFKDEEIIQNELIINCLGESVFLDVDDFYSYYSTIKKFTLYHSGKLIESISYATSNYSEIHYEPNTSIIRNYYCIKNENNESACGNVYQPQIVTGLDQITNNDNISLNIFVDSTTVDKPLEINKEFIVKNNPTFVSHANSKQYIALEASSVSLMAHGSFKFNDFSLYFLFITLMLHVNPENPITLYDSSQYQTTKRDFILLVSDKCNVILEGPWPSYYNSKLSFKRESFYKGETNVTLSTEYGCGDGIYVDEPSAFNFAFEDTKNYSKVQKNMKCNRIYFTVNSFDDPGSVLSIEENQISLEKANFLYSQFNEINLLIEPTILSIKQKNSPLNPCNINIVFKTQSSSLEIDNSCTQQNHISIKYTETIIIKISSNEIPFNVYPPNQYEIFNKNKQEYCIYDPASEANNLMVDDSIVEACISYANTLYSIHDFIDIVDKSEFSYFEVLLTPSYKYFDLSRLNGVTVKFQTTNVEGRIPKVNVPFGIIGVGMNKIVFGTATIMSNLIEVRSSETVQIKLIQDNIKSNLIPKILFQNEDGKIPYYKFTEGYSYNPVISEKFSFSEGIFEIRIDNIPIKSINKAYVDDFETLDYFKFKVNALIIRYNDVNYIQMCEEKWIINNLINIPKTISNYHKLQTGSSSFIINTTVNWLPVHLDVINDVFIQIGEFHNEMNKYLSITHNETTNVMIVLPENANENSISIIPNINYGFLNEQSIFGTDFCIGYKSSCLDEYPDLICIDKEAVSTLIKINKMPSLKFRFNSLDYYSDLKIFEKDLGNKDMIEFVNEISTKHPLFRIIGEGNALNKNLKFVNIAVQFDKYQDNLIILSRKEQNQKKEIKESLLQFNNLVTQKSDIIIGIGNEYAFDLTVNSLETDIYSMGVNSLSTIKVKSVLSVIENSINEITLSSESVKMIGGDFISTKPISILGSAKVTTNQSELLTLTVSSETTELPNLELVLKNKEQSNIKIANTFESVKNPENIKISIQSLNAQIDSESIKIPTIISNGNDVVINRPSDQEKDPDDPGNGPGNNTSGDDDPKKKNISLIIGCSVAAIVVVIVIVIVILVVLKRKKNQNSSSSMSSKNSTDETP